MIRTVTNIHEAKALINYFNGFHDAFIQRLSIISHDIFQERDIQTATDRLDLEIAFAHYNYQNGERPHNQLVEARFHEVMGLELSFSGLLYEWSVNALDVDTASRILESPEIELCLKAAVYQHRLNQERVWENHEDLSFTFMWAEFVEV